MLKLPAQISFNRGSFLSDIFQKPKNNLYDTVFRYVIRLWAIDIVMIPSVDKCISL